MNPNEIFTIEINKRKYIGKICYVEGFGWYWRNMEFTQFDKNGQMFTDLNYSVSQIRNIYNKVLHYCNDVTVNSNHFPWCRKFEDVTKILSYLRGNHRFIQLYV